MCLGVVLCVVVHLCVPVCLADAPNVPHVGRREVDCYHGQCDDEQAVKVEHKGKSSDVAQEADLQMGREWWPEHRTGLETCHRSERMDAAFILHVLGAEACSTVQGQGARLFPRLI